MESITGVILAGGQSRRFGKNKALAHLKGKTLIDRVVELMRGLFPDLLLSTNSPEEYKHLNLPTAKDIVKGLGPLGGIYSCLSCIENPYAFVVACDMPFLNPSLIQGILSHRHNYDIVVPRVKGKIEPIHACYAKKCLGEMKKLIEKKEFKIIRFYEMVKVYYMEEEEIRRYDPSLSSFRNINTQEDLEDYTAEE